MTGLSSKNPPSNIKRVDHDASRDHGWVVTMQRKGEIIVKRFSDGIYGGKREALKAAVDYRDSLLAQDQPFDHQIWIRTRLRKNNRSGIPGVHRYEVVDNPNTGNVREYWIAHWTDEHGATRQRKFSIARYGEEEAKLLAMAEREYQLHRVCTLNASRPEPERPDQEGIWEASESEARRARKGKRKSRAKNSRTHSTSRQNVHRKRGGNEKIQIVEAIIDRDGNVRLLEPVKLASNRHALVTIFTEGRMYPEPKR